MPKILFHKSHETSFNYLLFFALYCRTSITGENVPERFVVTAFLSSTTGLLIIVWMTIFSSLLIRTSSKPFLTIIKMLLLSCVKLTRACSKQEWCRACLESFSKSRMSIIPELFCILERLMASLHSKLRLNAKSFVRLLSRDMKNGKMSTTPFFPSCNRLSPAKMAWS